MFSSPRVDKDRSGVISDTELQQALSNGMDQCLGISATTVIVFLSRSINIYIYLTSFSMSIYHFSLSS